MTRIAASYIIHYGREYLYWSMKSVRPYVDEIHLFYTPWPSHGHATNLLNPESKSDLTTIVDAFSYMYPHPKVYWHDAAVKFSHEGQHREWAVNTCRDNGADMVLVVDADEIWYGDHLQTSLYEAWHSPARTHRVYMRHPWRSFYWVCDDGAAPTRIIKPNVSPQAGEDYIGAQKGRVWHMGYAQSPEIILYKQSIHGHKGEWRSNWFQDIFMAWQPGMGDVHPTNLDYWYPKPLESYELLTLLAGHPYITTPIIDHAFATQNPYTPQF